MASLLLVPPLTKHHTRSRSSVSLSYTPVTHTAPTGFVSHVTCEFKWSHTSPAFDNSGPKGRATTGLNTTRLNAHNIPVNKTVIDEALRKIGRSNRTQFLHIYLSFVPQWNKTKSGRRTGTHYIVFGMLIFGTN